jgi:hypothetical protein
VIVRGLFTPSSPYFCCSILCVHCFRRDTFHYLAPLAWSPRSRRFVSA